MHISLPISFIILLRMLYILMEGDLHTLSRSNITFKYADDTNLLQWYWLILTYNMQAKSSE